MSGTTKKVVAAAVQSIQHYILRVSFKGLLLWNCPYCGHFNRSQINQWTWRVKCVGKIRTHQVGPGSTDPSPHRAGNCDRWFIYFLGFVPMPVGHSTRPSDTIPSERLIERMPLGEFVRRPRWLSGDGVNRLVEVSDHPAFCCLHNVAGECNVEVGEK